MKYEQIIYIQNDSSCVRNSDIFNVNMSSDISTFVTPKYNISGATKINDEKQICVFSGTNYDNLVLSSMTNCFSGDTGCFDYLSWYLEINNDTLLVYSATVATSYSIYNSITQTQVDNAIIAGFNDLGYTYTYTGSSFTIQKPYGVENLEVLLCLDVNPITNIPICPSGYTLNTGGDKCVYITSTAATYLGSGSTISSGDLNNNYGTSGARFYENINDKQYPIIRTGDTSPIYYSNNTEVLYSNTITSSFWGNGSGFTGRLNNIGIKGSPDTEWLGFSQCYDFISGSTYYIGLAADNYCRFKINGELIVNFDSLYGGNYYLWHVFPFNFPSGKNIIEMEGKNAGSNYSFGFEIYSASSINQLTGATDETSAGIAWSTLGKIGDVFDIGETIAWSCISGYSIDLCSTGTPICTKILYDNKNTCGGLTDNCDMLCTILCDNIYETLNTGDTGVYIINTATTIDLGFQFTANTDSFITNNSTFTYEIFKYNLNSNSFSNIPIYKSDEIEYSSFSGTSAFTQSIPVSGLSIDGDYIIKGYYIHNYGTEFLDMLDIKGNTLNKIGDSYGLYKKAFDYYFTAIKEADIPKFNISSVGYVSMGSLAGYSIFPDYAGQTAFTFTQGYSGSPIVSLNGLTLVNYLEYEIINSANTLTIIGGTEIDDVITIILVSNGADTPGFTNDLINITSPIISGTTNNQGINNVYYNTTEGKYEIYAKVTPNPNDNLIVTLNGLTLASNIDYYKSKTNSKRIILNGSITVGDILNIYYNSEVQYIGNIYTNVPTIYWGINNPPVNNDGLFTIEVADINDTTFSSILFSATTQYIKNQTSYSSQLILTGSAGTKYIYRIKNKKNYITIVGDILTTVNYSETIPIQIQSNEINSY